MREAGFPNPRQALIGSNQLWRVNDSPYYREYHIIDIDIDFGGGDADSVVLIAWHLGIDKSCVLALALLLYQESEI